MSARDFVGYGASDGGMNWAPAGIPPRALREVCLHPFEAAVRVGGARSVMNAYNEIDGILCAADRDLLTGTLRDEWGFDGIVVSDYFAIRQLALMFSRKYSDIAPAFGPWLNAPGWVATRSWSESLRTLRFLVRGRSMSRRTTASRITGSGW